MSVKNPSPVQLRKKTNISAQEEMAFVRYSLRVYTLNFNAGSFTEVLSETLQHTSPKEPTGTRNLYEALPSLLPMYTVFQTVISNIFFVDSVIYAAQENNRKHQKNTFSLSSTRQGVEISKWKEMTFFLPSELKAFSTKNVSPFTVQFLGAKIDNGELPHNIFHSHVVKSALGAMLKIIEDLPACPGVYAPILVVLAERKSLSPLYFVDPKRVVVGVSRAHVAEPVTSRFPVRCSIN